MKKEILCQLNAVDNYKKCVIELKITPIEYKS